MVIAYFLSLAATSGSFETVEQTEEIAWNGFRKFAENFSVEERF